MPYPSTLATRLATLAASALLLTAGPALAATCYPTGTGQKEVLWGDLHVHTAHSLDAWAFGAVATPKEAYAFARGQPLRLANGTQAVIDRPLDFAAVTDHAETFDQMYLCTDPVYSDDPYCRAMRDARASGNGLAIFNDNLLPVVGSLTPQRAAVCEQEGVDCAAAGLSQWRRAQFAANAANEPCRFTALIGYEWTASPGGAHWHRNVIFRSDEVPREAFDFVRYPRVGDLWRQLSEHCRPADGCRALTIAHNINWADGGPTFAIETADPEALRLRRQYERLAEIFQEKGGAECLPRERGALDEDCSFELVLQNAAKERLSGPDTAPPAEAWARARGSYYRSLLARGLLASRRGAGNNPMMLGAIGSTDSHFGTPGRVAEAGYTRGIASLFLTDEQSLANTAFNPGGLVAVWAEENTRAAIFDALYRREAYGTSGPRILLRFGVTTADYCTTPGESMRVTMGGTLPQESGQARGGLLLTIQAARDQHRLARLQIIKGEVVGNEVRETVTEIAAWDDGRDSACVTWEDPNFDPAAPAYWYARVIEQPSPRWSQLLCEQSALCEKYPEADRSVSERAWSSPIWALP